MEASRKHHEMYSSQMSYYNKFLYLDIPLLCGHEETFLKNPFPANDEIRVVYTGVALQPMRNISYFVELAKKVNAIDPRIVFYVIGQSNCANMFNHKCIRYLDSMPHEQLLPYLESADVLINLGVRVPSAISGKIFEYMSFGKPIISTYSIPNEACITYLNRYPMSLLIEESDSGIEQAAKEMVDFISSNLGNRIGFNDIKSIYRNNLPETFIEEVFES
jgi:glycosyltransferase involved in cell wall biosynthesis